MPDALDNTWKDDRGRREQRERLSNIRVLLADRDMRIASLVQRILFSFGFRKIELVTSGEEALKFLRSHHYDLIITEYNMAPVDGIELVREIRAAREDKRIPRDIPIIMLTARSEKINVEAARDAGINEFIAKPFTAKTISNRIIQIIDNPRAFVESPGYTGPCRRRREKLPEGMVDRRLPPELRRIIEHRAPPTFILPPNNALREQLGEATALFTEQAILNAQHELASAEDEFLIWAKDDISTLKNAYTQLALDHNNSTAARLLVDAAYSIRSQAGIFGYSLGTEISAMLVQFLTEHPHPKGEQLVVVRKHIEAITVIFTQQIKDSAQTVGEELIKSLKILIRKMS